MRIGESPFMVAIAFVMVLNGFTYIVKYDHEDTLVSTEYITDHKYFKDINLDSGNISYKVKIEELTD
jgi:hypothetical protein